MAMRSLWRRRVPSALSFFDCLMIRPVRRASSPAAKSEMGVSRRAIRLLDKLLEQGHGRTKPPDAHAHLVHAFRIAMGHGILVCGEVVQAGKADDLKGLARSHGAMQDDVVPESRQVLFASTECVTALGL